MINVIVNTYLHPIVLDIIARKNQYCIGVSTEPNKSTVHLDDVASFGDQTKIQNVLDNFGNLAVIAVNALINEGGADPVVTCNDALVAGDSDIGYVVLLDGAKYASGTDAVSAGSASLTLLSPVDGEYEIFIYRTTGNYASGSVTITVNEV